jgi:hypothetical protein
MDTEMGFRNFNIIKIAICHRFATAEFCWVAIYFITTTAAENLTPYGSG